MLYSSYRKASTPLIQYQGWWFERSFSGFAIKFWDYVCTAEWGRHESRIRNIQFSFNLISTVTICSENMAGCFILTANPSRKAGLSLSLLACIDITTHSIFMNATLVALFYSHYVFILLYRHAFCVSTETRTEWTVMPCGHTFVLMLPHNGTESALKKKNWKNKTEG